MKTMCIFPPNFRELNKPYISLPALVGYLRGEGLEVRGIDANIEFYEYMTSQDGLRELQTQATQLFLTLEQESELRENQLLQYANLAWMVQSSSEDIYQIYEASKRILRSKAFFDYRQYSLAHAAFVNLFKLIDVLLFSREDKLNVSPYNNWQTFCALVQEECYNPYQSYYEKKLLPAIAHYQPEHVDITVDFYTQLLPAVYLAKKLKALFGERIYVTLSGDVCPRLKDSLRGKCFLQDYVDLIVMYDRQETLNQVISFLVERDLAQIHNLCNIAYWAQGQAVQTAVQGVSCIDNWGTPDYRDLPLNLYHAPEFEATIYASYGCYWRKCKFCNIYAACLQYRRRNVEKVLADIKQLVARHGIKVLAFGDEEVEVEHLVAIARRIIAEQISVKWSAQVRLNDPALTEEAAHVLKESGCVYLGFGLESGSDAVLERMDTGTKTDLISKILKNVKNAGIITNVSLIIGYFRENIAEWTETLNFLSTHTEEIDSILPLCYNLTKCSIAEENRTEQGITLVYDELMADNINMVFPNFFESEAGPSWQEREDRYMELMSFLASKYPAFGASSYPKLLYGYHYRANGGRELVEKVSQNSDAVPVEVAPRRRHLRPGLRVARLMFEMSAIQGQLKYNFSGNLPLRRLPSFGAGENFYLVDLLTNRWERLNPMQFYILQGLEESDEPDLAAIANKCGISLTKLESTLKIWKITNRTFFQ